MQKSISPSSHMSTATNPSTETPTAALRFSQSTEELRLENLRQFVAPLSKEQLIDLITTAALNHQDVFTKCSAAVAASAASRRLMVRNVPFSSTDEDFIALFRKFGEIQDALIVREKDGRSRGYGFVTFKILASVRVCLENKHVLDGKELSVKLAAAPSPDNEQRKLFIRNLPDYTDEMSLRNVFSQYGDLEECSVVKFRNGASKGYGFVTFTHARDAFKAVQQQERVIDGRVVFVYFATRPNDKRRDSSRRSGVVLNQNRDTPFRTQPMLSVRRPRGMNRPLYAQERIESDTNGIFASPYPYHSSLLYPMSQTSRYPYTNNVSGQPYYPSG